MSDTISAIIFDMDGLLIDSEILWEKVLKEVISSYGRSYDIEVARQHVGMRVDEAVHVMLEAYGIDCDPERFITQLLDALFVEFDRSLVLMPGAAALLEAAVASGLPLAIASSSPQRVVGYVVERYGWRQQLAAICCGDEVAQGKPAPDVFLLAAERLGVSPERCVVLEDSLNGARAARAAGMRCIAVPNPFYKPADFEGVATLVVPSLEKLTIETVLSCKLPSEVRDAA